MLTEDVRKSVHDDDNYSRQTVNYSALFFLFLLQIFQGLFVCFEVYGLKKTDHFDFYFLIGLLRKSIKCKIPSPFKIATVGLV